MKFFKKNQIIIYVIALMLVVAGYLSYTTGSLDDTSLVSTQVNEIASKGNIGDAQLVSGEVENQENTVSENIAENANENESTNSIEVQTATNTVNEANNVNSENTVNSTKNQNTVPTNSSSASDDYFTTSKLERDTMYSQMLETYQKVIDSPNSLETQRQSATEEITKINNLKNSIMICENLIGTKGFPNNVIFVNGDSVTAIIGADELTQEEVAQIQNIISRELNASIENIHIAIK